MAKDGAHKHAINALLIITLLLVFSTSTALAQDALAGTRESVGKVLKSFFGYPAEFESTLAYARFGLFTVLIALLFVILWRTELFTGEQRNIAILIAVIFSWITVRFITDDTLCMLLFLVAILGVSSLLYLFAKMIKDGFGLEISETWGRRTKSGIIFAGAVLIAAGYFLKSVYDSISEVCLPISSIFRGNFTGNVFLPLAPYLLIFGGILAIIWGVGYSPRLAPGAGARPGRPDRPGRERTEDELVEEANRLFTQLAELQREMEAYRTAMGGEITPEFIRIKDQIHRYAENVHNALRDRHYGRIRAAMERLTPVLVTLRRTVSALPVERATDSATAREKRQRIIELLDAHIGPILRFNIREGRRIEERPPAE